MWRDQRPYHAKMKVILGWMTIWEVIVLHINCCYIFLFFDDKKIIFSYDMVGTHKVQVKEKRSMKIVFS